MSARSTTVGQAHPLADTSLPHNASRSTPNSRHRRLIDGIVDGFSLACRHGDLESAADLITVLEDQRDRWIAQHGDERRRTESQIASMKDELIRRRQVEIVASVEARGRLAPAGASQRH